LIVKLTEIPEMSRGRGVMLQRYKDGGLADAKVFRLADGLSWRQGENRVRTETALDNWIGERAQAGRIVPAVSPRVIASAEIKPGLMLNPEKVYPMQQDRVLSTVDAVPTFIGAIWPQQAAKTFRIAALMLAGSLAPQSRRSSRSHFIPCR